MTLNAVRPVFRHGARLRPGPRHRTQDLQHFLVARALRHYTRGFHFPLFAHAIGILYDRAGPSGKYRKVATYEHRAH